MNRVRDIPDGYVAGDDKAENYDAPVILSSFALTALLTAVFMLRERRISYPLVDIGLFRDRNILFGLAVSILAVVAMEGIRRRVDGRSIRRRVPGTCEKKAMIDNVREGITP